MGGLAASLAELERLLAEDGDPLAELARLAEPARLEHLFQVRLAGLVRLGPGGAASPHELLATAQRAAAAGVLPAGAPSHLRRTLRELESLLHDAGAWDPERPAWWSPLPPPTPIEDLWASFGREEDGPLGLPSPDDVATAIRDPETCSLRLPLPSLLRTSLTRTIGPELEAAHREGRLELEREGVGAAGQKTVRRSDWVRYVSGLEPELLDAAPALAAFVQWALRRLAPRLSAGGRRVYRPRKAMLARYPAPSAGYAPHMDNPGGEHDNGRTLTLVLYLNAPGKECAGGEIAIWGRGESTEDPPAEVLPPRSGSAVLFDSREIAHQVRPLRDGPARWALTFWFNDTPQEVEPYLPLPRLGLTEVLLPISSPPLVAGKVLFHELDDAKSTGEIVVRRSSAPTDRRRPRAGIVSTVYREGERLDSWCEHHFELGFDHLVLVFDHLEEPEEQAGAERLRARYGEERLSIWSGAAAARRPLKDTRLDELRQWAELGSASYAISSRQALNASAALEAARGDELGGSPLDWLLHLDADELFHLEGRGRGGATVAEHFSAAADAGLELVRYVNHELLLPWRPGSAPRFKINPRLAAARLGPGGWKALVEHLELAQTDPRPWFNGYFNGKSAVRVRAGAAAAGVHGWFLKEDEAKRAFVAGPSILHFHFSTPEAFRRKYLAIASAPPLPPGRGLFDLSPSEQTTVGLIRRLKEQGAEAQTVSRRLEELHETMTSFSEADVELLDEAGLVWARTTFD